MSVSASLQDLDNPENFHSLFNLVEADPMRQQNMLGDVGFDIFNWNSVLSPSFFSSFCASLIALQIFFGPERFSCACYTIPSSALPLCTLCSNLTCVWVLWWECVPAGTCIYMFVRVCTDSVHLTVAAHSSFVRYVCTLHIHVYIIVFNNVPLTINTLTPSGSYDKRVHNYVHHCYHTVTTVAREHSFSLPCALPHTQTSWCTAWKSSISIMHQLTALHRPVYC